MLDTAIVRIADLQTAATPGQSHPLQQAVIRPIQAQHSLVIKYSQVAQGQPARLTEPHRVGSALPVYHRSAGGGIRAALDHQSIGRLAGIELTDHQIGVKDIVTGVHVDHIARFQIVGEDVGQGVHRGSRA